MSLALFMLARDIVTVAQTAAAASQIASSVVTIKNVTNINRARAEAMGAPRAPAQPINLYEVNLFLAKVAMLAYIAKSDRMISPEERVELEQTLAVAENVYGREATDRARLIFNNEGLSFMALEPYLRSVQNQDLDSFLFYSEEYAKSDNELTQEENAALQKLRSYVDSRKGKKSFNDLTCAKCGGAMHADAYGYKATCGYCGYEIILNTDNSPQKTTTSYKCTRCGVAYDSTERNVKFCKYCGGMVVNAQTVPQQRNNFNLYISYTSFDPNVNMVTRIVSTGMKHNYTSGKTMGFRLAPGRQSIVLKIGRINYNRDVVIPSNNVPVRIYASYSGRAHIVIEQTTV
jgi:DNA-directed RNA polymerase subunit RPC12/RpoP